MTTTSINSSTLTNTLEEIITGIKLHGIENVQFYQTSDNISKYIDRINDEHLAYPQPNKQIDSTHWFIPADYSNMDIEKHILDLCNTEQELERVKQELELYRQYDFLDVLRCMKYIIDTLRENKVVWGVGRGSSVASYVLFLLGVHKIDSLKYNLPLDEFFKGEANG